MQDKKNIFSTIYDDNIGKIYRFIFLKVSGQEIAEDLTSETFSRGWNKFKDGSEDIKNCRAFLYQIARNLVTDHYREKGRAQFVPTEELQINDPKQNVGELAALSSDIESIRKSLTSLKDDYQNVIIWHYLDDMPIKEVAQLLDRSEETTRVLLHRALGALKGEVQEV